MLHKLKLRILKNIEYCAPDVILCQPSLGCTVKWNLTTQIIRKKLIHFSSQNIHSQTMRFPTFLAYRQWTFDTSSYSQLLDDENKRRRDRRIPRCALRPFKFSSFKYLYVE